MTKKKIIPIILILVGAAFLLGAIISWFDNLTATEPVGLGKWIFDILVALVGAGSGIKGWIDWKKETPSQVTNITASDGAQIATGNHGRNIQAEEYKEQNIQNYFEASKPEKIFSPLYQLPQPPADFTGRKKLIEQLLSDFNSHKGAAISGLTGMGGIGKTALGLEVAHKIAEKYPDAQIFLDLKGTTTPLSAIDIARHVILSFKPAADLRALDESNFQAAYQSVLHGKKALLFLDNARSAEQIAPLRPPETCAMLVTSRWTFVVPGLQNRRVDVMDEGDAKEFLLELCPRIGEKASELAKNCGFLPLALRIAGSFLQVNNDWPIETYIAQLRDHKHRLITLRESRKEADLTAVPDLLATFELSYNQLTEENQRRWRMLGVFNSSFSKHAVKEICKLTKDETIKTANHLNRYSLVILDVDTGRYTIHDLLRDFAISKLNNEEEFLLRSNFAKYYLELLRHANNLYLQGRENIKLSLQILDLELENIIAAQLWATENSGLGDILELVNEFPNAGYKILPLRLHPRVHLSWLISGIESAKKLGDEKNKVSYLSNLGGRYSALGEFDIAIKYYEKALAAAQLSNDRAFESHVIGNIGSVYIHTGEIGKAFEFLQKALLIKREIDDQKGIGWIGNKLGVLHRKNGNPDRAIEFHQESLRIAREQGDKDEEADSIDELGIAYDHLGNPDKAINYFLDALRIAKEIGNRDLEGIILNNLGVVHGKMGNMDKAIEYLLQQLEFARELENPASECNVLGNLGLAYGKLGDIQKAISYHEQNLALARRIGYRESEAAALTNLGGVHLENGENDKCVHYWKLAVPILEAIGSPHTDIIREGLKALDN